jgi:hypothetical protein
MATGKKLQAPSSKPEDPSAKLQALKNIVESFLNFKPSN